MTPVTSAPRPLPSSDRPTVPAVVAAGPGRCAAQPSPVVGGKMPPSTTSQPVSTGGSRGRPTASTGSSRPGTVEGLEDLHQPFIEQVGAAGIGASTYDGPIEHENLREHPRGWPWDVPARVFSHRALPAVPGADRARRPHALDARRRSRRWPRSAPRRAWSGSPAPPPAPGGGGPRCRPPRRARGCRCGRGTRCPRRRRGT